LHWLTIKPNTQLCANFSKTWLEGIFSPTAALKMRFRQAGQGMRPASQREAIWQPALNDRTYGSYQTLSPILIAAHYGSDWPSIHEGTTRQFYFAWSE
jgi:hypothetical protein